MALRLPASKASKLLTKSPSIHPFSLPSHLSKFDHVSNLSSQNASPSNFKRKLSSSLRRRHSSASSSRPNPTESSQPIKSSKADPKENANPGFEAASFSDMFKSASKRTRMVLIVGFMLVSTAESVTWGIWGWNKWKSWGGEKGGEVENGDGKE